MLNKSGCVVCATKRFIEAEEQYMKAIHLLSVRDPIPIEYAMCLFNFGVLFRRSGRRSEAVVKFEEARQLYREWGYRCL